jgi:hypothetical protein
MALRITYPQLDDTETYLIAAFQDLGAEHISGDEWHFKRSAISPAEFLAKLREVLPDDVKQLAGRVKITSLRP